jgi:capsular polysaccharide transport system permease protein
MEVLPIPRSSPAADDAVAAAEPPVRRWSVPRPDRLFLLVVVAPVLIAIVYFGFLATPVYISESSFVVRNPEKPQPSLLGGILQGAGFTPGTEEVYAAQAFAVSRDALRELNRKGAVERAYTRPDIFWLERFDPLGLGGKFENLYDYFTTKVTVKNDTTTSITTLTVRAYDPVDAQRFNERLLEMSEATVNQLNERGRRDLVRYSQDQVVEAKAQAQAAGAALAAYRNRSGVVDPEKQADAQMQMVSKLQDQLIATKTQLAQLMRYTPENPRIPSVRTQLGVIQHSIDVELGKVTGGSKSLAQSAVRYQQLMLQNEFASKQLTAALASLEQARNEALRKQAYVERIVQPNLPDGAMEPHRLRGILAVLALSLLAYGILRMMVSGLREHAR